MLTIGSHRALRSFQNKESIVGKLFAKHIKLEEAKQFLQRARYDCHLVLGLSGTNSSHRMGIGAGTPARISDLIESGKQLLWQSARDNS